jgi:urea transport system substrate-binding protein
MGNVDRRQLLKWALGISAAGGLSPLVSACAGPSGSSKSSGNIKLGFLTAFTGLETLLGQTQYNCFKLAVDQINAKGGIADRKISIYKEDDATDSKQTIDKANQLALKDQVTAVIGLISSLEKEAAMTVLPKEKTPLMYTTYYEGAYGGAKACDPNYVGMGQVPNQQIVPLVPWLSKNVGKSYYVVGSDYIWPRATTEALKQSLDKEGGRLLGAEYYPFGTNDFGKVFRNLQSTKPDICWVALAGTDFTTFLKQYEQFNAKPKLVSCGLDDVFSRENPGVGKGAIASQSYFMTIPGATNKKFLADYHKAYGNDKPVNAIGELAYDAVWLVKAAIEKAGGSLEASKWTKQLAAVSFAGPSGTVRIDSDNQHCVSNSYIGEVQSDGSIKILTSDKAVAPDVTGCHLSS